MQTFIRNRHHVVVPSFENDEDLIYIIDDNV